MEFLIAPPVGVAVGILLGMLGGGGAILAVPALVYLLGLHPKAATFGSLIIVVVSAPAALIGHWRAGRVRFAAGVAFAAAGLAGSFLGSQVSTGANPNVLLTGFAALMLVIAGLMAWRLRQAATAPAAAVTVSPPRREPIPAVAGAAGAAGPPSRAAHTGIPGISGAPDADADADAGSGRAAAQRLRQLALLVPTASGIGFLTGLFGVGGGIIVVPTLVLVLGFEMPIAVGTSLVVIILNSLAAITARVGSHIALNWTILGLFTASAIVGAVAGNKLAEKVDTRRLTQAFVVLIVVVAVYTAGRSLLQLS
jgi:uncharacterized protein